MTVGELLDTLGVDLDIGEGHLTEAVVIGKVADFTDGSTAVAIGTSEGLDWIAQRGLLSAAQHVIDASEPPEQAGG